MARSVILLDALVDYYALSKTKNLVSDKTTLSVPGLVGGLVGGSCRWSCRRLLSVSCRRVLSVSCRRALSEICLVTSAQAASWPTSRVSSQPCGGLVGALSALFRKNVKLNLDLVGALSGPCFGLVGVLSVPFGSIGAFFVGPKSFIFSNSLSDLVGV